MAAGGIATYYDRLTRWNSVARAIGYGGGHRRLTVHRPLADPRAHGRATTTRLHDILIEQLPWLNQPRVLDAGCGLGGTMIDLAERIGGQYVGLTLSETQAAIARRAIAGAELTDRVQVLVRDYNAPPSGPFDLVLAIESLAHSSDPAVSLRALTGVLGPGGVLAIVDDMPEPGAERSADLAAFKEGWRCPVVWGRAQYDEAFARLGLQLVVERDLSSERRPRGVAATERLEAINRCASRLVPSAALRDVLLSHRGGLALERLSRAGLVSYRLLVASLAA